MLIATASALTPPRETVHAVGTDSKGVVWKVRTAVGEPMLVIGVRNFSVKTQEPFDLFETYAAIDSRDTAWIVDGKGRGVRVKLADGAAEEFRVPVSKQLVGGIAVTDGKLYFGDSDALGGRAVRRIDVASSAMETLLTWNVQWSSPRLWPHKGHLWITNSSGLTSSQRVLELVALDWLSGKVVRRAQREMPLAAQAWTNFELVEAEDGTAWVADGPSVRVERLDASGTWKGWSLDGRTPSNLVTARFGAACLLRRLQPPQGPQFPGGPIQPPTVLRREIAAFQADSGEIMTCPVETDVSLSADRDGDVRVEGRGRLSLEGGRLHIVPAASPPEQPKPPK
jgi:streptogramin lyase